MINKKLPDFMPPARPSRQRKSIRNHYAAYQRLAAIYLLRLVLGLQKSLKRAQLIGFFEDDVGRITGLDQFNGTQDLGDDGIFPHTSNKAALLKCMRQQLDTLLEEGVGSSEMLFDNIRLLGKTLKLSPVEQEILVLRLLIPLLEGFREIVIHYCNSCTMQATVDYLQLMTTRPAREIRNALQADSQLLQIGWLSINPSLADLEDKLLLADGLLDILLRPHDNADALFANFFQPAQPTKLVLADYAHLQNDMDVLLPYLRTALAEKHPGVNILIYGPPGVGKTQFAKLLAQSVNAALYEVLCADQDGNSLQGKARFAACNLSQKLLSKKRGSLLLFDEAEDVFPAQYRFFLDDSEDDDEEEQTANSGGKAWINQQLETNPVPVIWISNRT